MASLSYTPIRLCSLKSNSYSLPTRTYNCDIYHYSKSTRLPFSLSLSKTTRAFELVHSHVWGPFSISIDGFKYFVTFIDDFSNVTWVYLLKSKGEVANYFKQVHVLVTTQFSSHIKTLRSDNSTEYTSHDMKIYLVSNGILQLMKKELGRFEERL